MSHSTRALARHARKPAFVVLAVAALGFVTADTLNAATATGNMSVQLVITSSCTVDSVGTMDFGSAANLSAPLSATADIDITCTNTTPYTIELDPGGGTGATTAVRKLTSGANTIDYSIYKEVGHVNVWGEGATDDVDSTGTASQQTFTAYGLVPAQALPNPGTYTDTVTVTVTY